MALQKQINVHKRGKEKENLVTFLPRRFFQRSTHLPQLLAEMSGAIFNTHRLFERNLSKPSPQSDFFKEGKSTCVYPTASCFLARDMEKPVICIAAAPGANNPAPGQVSGKCIRSNSMINNKINSIPQAKGVGIQRGQASHSSWGYTTHSFPEVSRLPLP